MSSISREYKAESNSHGLARKVIKWEKPIFIALIILGIVGLGLLGANYLSAQHGCWSVGVFSDLTQIQAIVWMTVSGGLFVAGAVGLAQSYLKKEAKASARSDTATHDRVLSSSGTSSNVDIRKLKSCPHLPSSFSDIKSGTLVKAGSHNFERKDFLRDRNWKTAPPIISKSEFVSDKMAAHLMLNKKGSALGEKYNSGDKITNMEAALHTFVTPICSIHMVGDYFIVEAIRRSFLKKARKGVL